MFYFILNLFMFNLIFSIINRLISFKSFIAAYVFIWWKIWNVWVFYICFLVNRVCTILICLSPFTLRSIGRTLIFIVFLWFSIIFLLLLIIFIFLIFLFNFLFLLNKSLGGQYCLGLALPLWSQTLSQYFFI